MCVVTEELEDDILDHCVTIALMLVSRSNLWFF